MHLRAWMRTIFVVLVGLTIVVGRQQAVVAGTQGDMKDAVDKAKKAAQDAAQKEAAAKQAEDANKAAADARQKADDAKKKADETGDPKDKKAADKAEQEAQKAENQPGADAAKDQHAADEAQKKADAAKDKADKSGDPKDKNAADKAQKDADAAKDKAKKSKDAADKKRADADKAKADAKKALEAAEKAIEKAKKEGIGTKKYEDDLKRAQGLLDSIAMGPAPTGESLATLMGGGKVTASLAGTGETIGHIADLTLKNMTTETLNVTIPATVLTSISGQCQPYAIPEPQSESLGAGETKTVPLSGVCLNGRLPPVGSGVTGELNMADPTSPDFAQHWGDALKGTQAVIAAAKQLQGEGAFTTPFSGDPQKERETVIQQTIWLYTSTKEGNPLTKADMAKKVLEQAETAAAQGGGGGLTEPQKEQLNQGVDNIWKAVQLTGKQAKVL